VVSGEPDFFKRAFGDTVEDFERILLLPHDLIFNREWYERLDPDRRMEAHSAEVAKLDSYERSELIELLSSCDPREFTGLSAKASTTAVKRVLPFYIPVPKEELYRIWEKQKDLARHKSLVAPALPEDERVEDAGLEDEEEVTVAPGNRPHTRQKAAA
jgi:hypothetical protein